jgi:hypothetical protein
MLCIKYVCQWTPQLDESCFWVPEDLLTEAGHKYCDRYGHLLCSGSQIHVTLLRQIWGFARQWLSRHCLKQNDSSSIYEYLLSMAGQTHVPAATNVKKGIPMTTTWITGKFTLQQGVSYSVRQQPISEQQPRNRSQIKDEPSRQTRTEESKQ